MKSSCITNQYVFIFYNICFCSFAKNRIEIQESLYSELLCYGLNVYVSAPPPQDIYVEALVDTVMVFGGVTFV